MNDNPSTSGRIVKYSEEWWATRTPEVRARRCHKGEDRGEHCRKVAMEGQRVCGTHGGRAPQAKAAARRRLDEAADRMAKQLLGIAESAESESVKLAAVRDALDRAGLKPPAQVEIGPREQAPWEELMGDVMKITKAQHDALKRGEPLPPPAPAALPPADDDWDIVDAEVVDPDEYTARPARVDDGTCDGDDRAETLPPASAHPPQPPSTALVSLEEANADVNETNRRAKVVPIRRRH